MHDKAGFDELDDCLFGYVQSGLGVDSWSAKRGGGGPARRHRKEGGQTDSGDGSSSAQETQAEAVALLEPKIGQRVHNLHRLETQRHDFPDEIDNVARLVVLA